MALQNVLCFGMQAGYKISVRRTIKSGQLNFFFENRKHWQFLGTTILGYKFIYVKIKHYLRDDRKFSPLTKSLGIPCLIAESLWAVTVYSSYVRP
jgi:hypothetical protein